MLELEHSPTTGLVYLPTETFLGIVNFQTVSSLLFFVQYLVDQVLFG